MSTLTIREQVAFMRSIGYTYNYRTKKFTPYKNLKNKIILDDPTPKRAPPKPFDKMPPHIMESKIKSFTRSKNTKITIKKPESTQPLLKLLNDQNNNYLIRVDGKNQLFVPRGYNTFKNLKPILIFK